MTVVSDTTLTRLQSTIARAVPARDLLDMPYTELETYWNPILDSMIVQLRSHIFAEQLVEDEYTANGSVEVPATWVQHLRKRLGLQYRTETVMVPVTIRFTRYASYPKARYNVPPEMGDPVLVEFAKQV